MLKAFWHKVERPYRLLLYMYGLFFIYALAVDSPAAILEGFGRILTSQSILITDYIQVGGLGATLLNAVIVGSAAVFFLVKADIKPSGAMIMALWLTTGFAFFGKNLFNMIPITFGVWLYAKIHRRPFSDFSLVALLSATLSPVVSEISFLGILSRPYAILFGILLGVLTGLLFPAISAHVVRVHDGFNLYNMGFAGGLIAMFIVSGLRSLGVEMDTVLAWSSGNNLELALLLYLLAAGLIAAGFVQGKGQPHSRNMERILGSTGRLVSDYYVLYGETVYINMGILLAFSTSLVLALGADLNGATIGGVFTVAGFGCFGKNIKNCLFVVVGAILSTLVNMWDPTSPGNIIAILFSTGLAPIAGQYGWLWGIVAGFLHVNVVMQVGYLSGGLNLYNNGFAAGFVALFLVPVINSLRKFRRKGE